MWEINNGLQLLSLVRAIAFGFLLSAFYDVFKAFRLSRKQTTAAVALQDIIFFTISAILCFCFLLAVTNGEIRGYILLAMLIGFFIFRLTVSKFWLFAVRKLFWFLFYILRAFRRVFYKCVNYFYVFFCKILKIMDIFLQKVKIACKKDLKKLKCLLYNKRK